MSQQLRLEPPSTNREAQLTQPLLDVGLYYLSGTSALTIDEVLGTLSEFTGGLEEVSHGTKLYGRLWKGIAGLTVQTESRMGGEEVFISLPGEACEFLGTGATRSPGNAARPSANAHRYGGGLLPVHAASPQ